MITKYLNEKFTWQCIVAIVIVILVMASVNCMSRISFALVQINATISIVFITFLVP